MLAISLFYAFQNKDCRTSRAIGCAFAILIWSQLVTGKELDQVAGNLITFNTNGAWSWYQDERVIVDNGRKLLMSSAADSLGPTAVPVTATSMSCRMISHLASPTALFCTQHWGRMTIMPPQLSVRPDGRYLAMYTRHNADTVSHYRISTNPHDATSGALNKPSTGRLRQETILTSRIQIYFTYLLRTARTICASQQPQSQHDGFVEQRHDNSGPMAVNCFESSICRVR